MELHFEQVQEPEVGLREKVNSTNCLTMT